MKKIINVVVSLFIFQITHAQGTIYLSNLSETSAGSLQVGSDLWLAADFHTGNDTGGYSLDSITLEMMDATGNPDNFLVMVYSSVATIAIFPGSSLGALNGSANPSTAGIYTYIPASSLTLLPNTDYFIVLTAATAVADNANYNWSYVTANSYNPSAGWRFPLNGVLTSGNGSSWDGRGFVGDFPQFAITATPIPEPSSLALLFLGSGVLFYVCRPWRRYLIK
jgi:hypothetical protein